MAASDANESISESIRVAVKGADLPERKYFKIGEVAQIVGVEPHVLRYWQTQFPQVRPQKSRSGHRLYKRRDVETLLGIRELLHVQRFTIAGAKQALRALRSPKSSKNTLVAKDQVKTIGRAANVKTKAAPKGVVPSNKASAPAMAVEVVDVVALDSSDLQDALSTQLADEQGEQSKVWIHSDENEDDHQLGFAFDDSALAKLESAKSELLGLLELLDSPRV